MQTWWLEEQKPFCPLPASLGSPPTLQFDAICQETYSWQQNRNSSSVILAACASAHILAKVGKLIYMQIQTIDEFVDLIWKVVLRDLLNRYPM